MFSLIDISFSNSNLTDDEKQVLNILIAKEKKADKLEEFGMILNEFFENFLLDGILLRD